MHNILASLGVSFENELSLELCPEEAVISLIKDENILEKRRELSLLILAFQTFQDYFRPDLFSHLIKDEDDFVKKVLGGIIFRDGLKNETRWKRLKTKLSVNNRNRLVIGNKRLIELQGHDEFFYKFGINMTRVKASSQKKIMASDWVLKNNFWFLNRIVFGANTRADINTIKMNQLESTPYSISKRFKQSYSSIHGIWKDIIYAQKLGLQIS